MEILLAFIFGGAIGTGAHVMMAHRETRGVLVAPIIGALAGGLVWMLLTWLGVTPDNPLLWIGSIAGAFTAVLPVTALLARARISGDRRERARLKIS